ALLHDVDEGVGGVGRQPHEPDDLEVAGQLLAGDAEALADLLDGGPVLRRDPRDHGQEPLHPGGGRLGAHARASSHSTISARSSGGSSTWAWSRKDRTNERNADRLVTGSSTTTASSSSATTASGPRCCTAHRAPGPSMCTRARTGGSAPSSHAPRAWPGTAVDGGSKRGRSVTSTSPWMRSRRKLRSSSRPWSYPLRYQRPRWNSRRYGSTVRSASRYRNRTGRRADTAANSRGRLASAGSGATCTSRPLAGAPT